MKVKAHINVYEMNGQTCLSLGEFEVSSHWNKPRDLVILKFEDRTVTVSRRELLNAIEFVTLSKY